ncbi:MAG: mechanosensitive ion channel family protein, partial [Candidatus Omnitrophota bacterium]
MDDITLFGFTVSAWIYAPAVYFVWVSILLLLKKMFYGHIQRLAEKTSSKIDDIFLGALDLPLILLIFVSGAVILDRIAPLR